MTDIEKLDLQSMDIKQQQIENLKSLFPEAFTEGNKVDWDKLRLTLGETIDVGKERYGMNWPGKADCFKTIQQSSIATLIPARDESINFDTTENLFIEGDNLEVLKLLQKSYLGKIKMIYIDPPYNTGNDFIYPDNYTENIQTYLEYTGQVDSEGRKFGTNTDTDGRFHSKWMNMMYPRLFLAKNIMREDGVIFISIDDSEMSNLKALCNEIFGEENAIGIFVWQSKKGGGSDSKTIVIDHEYILCYAKSSQKSGIGKLLIESEELNLSDEKGNYRRGRELNKWGSNSRRQDRPTMWFPIEGPNGIDVFPIKNDGTEGCWRYGKANMIKFVQQGDVEFVKRTDGTYIVYEKIRSAAPRHKPFRTWLDDVPSTSEGSKEVKNLFLDKKVFDFPKPVKLLKQLISIGVSKEDGLILDFFAGSGSLAQAVLEYNLENPEQNLNFICVQLPQTTEFESESYKEGYETIADISKERIRRVINKINEPKETPSKKIETKQTTLGLDLGENTIGWTKLEKGSIEFGEPSATMNESIDLGFKVFKLTKSNFKIWDSNVEKTDEAIQTALELHVEHISPEAKQEAILYELLLKSGFELTTPIQQLTIEGQNVFSIADGQLLVCLEKELTYELIKSMAELQPTRVICLDEGFHNNDQLKTNAVQIMKSKGVINFRTV